MFLVSLQVYTYYPTQDYSLVSSGTPDPIMMSTLPAVCSIGLGVLCHWSPRHACQKTNRGSYDFNSSASCIFLIFWAVQWQLNDITWTIKFLSWSTHVCRAQANFNRWYYSYHSWGSWQQCSLHIDNRFFFLRLQSTFITLNHLAGTRSFGRSSCVINHLVRLQAICLNRHCPIKLIW